MIKNEKAFILTGAPGSGKSSLLKLLSKEGVACVDEPARAIIAQQRKVNGQGLSIKILFYLKSLCYLVHFNNMRRLYIVMR